MGYRELLGLMDQGYSCSNRKLVWNIGGGTCRPEPRIRRSYGMFPELIVSGDLLEDSPIRNESARPYTLPLSRDPGGRDQGTDTLAGPDKHVVLCEHRSISSRHIER
jgi:hypothetical protein